MEDKKGVLIQYVTTKNELADLIRECIEPILQSKYKDQEIVEKEEGNEEELWTVVQMSEFFKVSTTTIHAWKNNGVIPYIRINSRIRFKKSEVLKLHEKRRRRRI